MIYAGFEIEVESSNGYSSGLDNIYNLIDKTTHITEWKSRYGILNYHGSRNYTNVGKWGVESDASLLNGAEFVSPIEEKSDAIHVLEEFLSYIDEANCYTHTSCGLHLNISADNRTVAGMDNHYFLSNINQKLLHALWGNRLKGTNVHCMPMKKILAFTRPLSILDTDIQNIMFKGKYKYVNKRTSAGGSERLEIRVMGGAGYHKKIKEIKKTINMFCTLLEESYEKSQPKSKKRIISYINRIQNKKSENYNLLWVPIIGQIRGINSFFYLLDSIKTTLENTKYPKDIDTMLESIFFNSYNIWEDYCFRLLLYLRSYIDAKNLDTVSIKKTTQKINEVFYYIFKHLDRIGYKIQKSMFNHFLNGLTRIDNYKIILNIPKDEKAVDTFWLCKYFEKLSESAKKRFVNNLSLSALRFIKKKEIATMKDVINYREKQLIEKKQENNIS